MDLLTERHAKQIAVSFYDRVIVQGTLPVFCYADGMTAYLSQICSSSGRFTRVIRSDWSITRHCFDVPITALPDSLPDGDAPVVAQVGEYVATPARS